MKKLLLGIMVIGSFSSFAAQSGCDLTITGNMHNSRLDKIKDIVREKGYRVIYGSNADYNLHVTGNSEMFQEGEGVQVFSRLRDLNENKTIHLEESSAFGIFVGNRWKYRIKKTLKDMPEC
jgi:hypothetical protein